MPMDYASQASATPTSGTTVVVSKPSGTAEGDVLIAMVSISGSNPTITPPSGWTLVVSLGATGGGVNSGVWTKVAGGSEPTTYTWTSSNTIVDSVGAIVRYTPASPTTSPGVIDATAKSAIATPAVAPSVTATGDNDRLICLFTGNTPGSTPSGMAQRVAIDGGSSGVWIYDELLTANGATGTRTWTGAASSIGWTVALLGNQQGSRIRMMI
jgi:hypothetical protein